MPPTGDSSAKKSLTTLAMGGAAAGVGGKIANVIIGIGSVAILARLLSPLDYGLFGLVSICLAVGQLMPQSISSAIVQHSDAKREDLNSAFTFILLTAVFSSLILVLGRHQISYFFDGAEISGPIIFAAILMPVASMNIFLEGLLGKNFEFQKNAAYEFFSTLLGQTFLTILLAYWGFGVWALLWGVGATAIIKLTLQIHATSARALRVRIVPLDLVMRSAWFFLLNIGNYLGRNADNIVVGKVLGSEMLGIYQRAFNLMMRPVQVVGGVTTGVLYPLMASVQDETERLRSAYLKSMVLTALLGLPISLVLFVHGREIVAILFGARWSAVAAPFQILSIALYFRLAYRVTETASFAVGAMGAATSRQFFYALAVIAGALIGSRWGLVGVATGVAFALVCFFFVSALFVNSLLKASMGSFLSTHLAGAFVAILSVLPTVVWLDSVNSIAGPFGVLMFGGVALVASYGAFFWLRSWVVRDAISRAVLDDISARGRSQFGKLFGQLRRRM